MMSTKQVVLALLVSAQIASAAEGVVETSFFSNWLSSGKDVAATCAQTVCENKTAVAALIAVSGISAAAYYNWDRVQQAYNKAVSYVKENKETITYTLKVGAVVTSVAAAVAGAGYLIKGYFFDNQNQADAENEVAPAAEQSVTSTENVEKKK